MKQADLGLNLTTKRTRKREFLDEMNRVVPWAALVELVAAHAPEGKKGRPPFPVETMLRIHFMQQWFKLSDPAMEEALHDIALFREFAGLGWDSWLPDESTVLRFRHLLEKYKLAEQILAVVNDLLLDKGLMHTVRGTAANVNDVIEAHSLLHGAETDAFGDAGYQGVHKRPDAKCDVNWHVAMRPGKRRALDKDRRSHQLIDELEHLKASIRAKVEHPFRVVKRQFGHVKVRYRGLKKNTAQLRTLFALSNLWMARAKLLQLDGQVRLKAANAA